MVAMICKTSRRNPPARCAPLKAPGAAPSAFTLIEMMIVILILAILVGLLFPVIIRYQGWGREKKAMMEVKNIEIAIKTYRSVYGKWPNQDQSARDRCYSNNNADVIGALTTNATANPRGILFLQFQQSSISTAGSYLDPWRHPYIIITDDSGDSQIAVNAEGLPATNATVPVLHSVQAILTNLTGKVTTNTLNFVGNFTVGVASWGNREIKLDINQGNYRNMDLCSWQMGAKTK